MLTRRLALILAVPAAIASGQEPAPVTPPTTTGAAPAAPSVEQTASPALVGELVKELAITPGQAQSGAEVGKLLAGALK